MSLFEVEKEKDSKYSRATKKPHYAITGEKPTIQSLYDAQKSLGFINEINNSNVSEEEKKFLRFAAYRHVAYRFDMIAEYYAHASKEMQELMEKSALVIIDINDAIANGYVKLTKELMEIVEENKNG